MEKHFINRLEDFRRLIINTSNSTVEAVNLENYDLIVDDARDFYTGVTQVNI